MVYEIVMQYYVFPCLIEGAYDEYTDKLSLYPDINELEQALDRPDLSAEEKQELEDDIFQFCKEHSGYYYDINEVIEMLKSKAHYDEYEVYDKDDNLIAGGM